MKSIDRIVFNNVKTVFETNYFKISLFLMIVLSLYGGYLSIGQNYLEGFISILSFPIYFVFGILMPFLVMSLCSYSLFDKNEYLICRLKTKKEYLKILIFTIFIVNLVSFVLMLIVLIISLNLFPKAGFGFKYNQFLNCHNFLYLIFVIVRLFFIVEFLSITSMLLCKMINQKIVIILNIILYSSFIVCSYLNTKVINSILNIPLYIGNYLIVSKYETFSMELTCTTIYILGLLILSYLIFIMAKKRLKDIKL